MIPPPRDAVKPLFVPLKAEYYRDFASGMKDTEYRRYGPRWNERTCEPGRRVVLSLGYGKRERISGVIAGLLIEPLCCLESHIYRELSALFPGIESHARIACVRIVLDGSERLRADQHDVFLSARAL